MKAFMLALALANSAVSPPAPKWTDATPPLRFQRTGLVPVLFVPKAKVQEMCATGTGNPPANMTIIACTYSLKIGSKILPVVLMPDPCPASDWDVYAQILCHENSHYLAGWKHETE